MKYHEGKIYKILNSDTDDVYVGATCQRLAKRMMNHRTKVKEGKETTLYNKMREIGIEHFYIELIENYPCENSEQHKCNVAVHSHDYMRSCVDIFFS